ncbi:hypothetical protein [Bacillus alkalicellulosilyticus]|uniref:hypothetical protein n=1 Tax=Alkalihalobacterium alkalicellulosilyticum TaxID=1912214 RepID=UPI000997A5DA|nr:hypothetical protein [Bacillus alkalicellulosilyticus]
MKVPKVLLTVSVTILAIFTVVGYMFFVEGHYVPADTLFVNEVTVSDENILIDGATISSGNGFSKHSYFIEDGNLYVKLKYSIVSRFNPGGDFKVFISESTEDIAKIYIQGLEKDDNELVWEKQ